MNVQQLSRNIRRSLVGEVTSRSGNKSIKVSYFYKGRHPKYLKEVKRCTVVCAHDEENACSIGDKVQISETRPISRTKRWRVVSILQKTTIS